MRDNSIQPNELTSDEEVSVKLDGEEPVVNVFKTISEAHVGDLSFFRVYSGSVNAGMDMLNTTRSKTERFGQMYLLNGKNRMSVNRLNAGDIGAVVKLKDTHTSNTLCSQKFQVVMDPVVLPNSNIHVCALSQDSVTSYFAWDQLVGRKYIHIYIHTYIYTCFVNVLCGPCPGHRTDYSFVVV